MTEENNRHAERDESRNKHWSKTKCPLTGCSSELYNLKRQLIDVHNWDDTKASAAKSVFGLYRARKQKGTPLRKRQYPRRYCPIGGCQKVCKRMENHLKNVHKIPNGAYYRTLSKNSKRFVEINTELDDSVEDLMETEPEIQQSVIHESSNREGITVSEIIEIYMEKFEDEQEGEVYVFCSEIFEDSSSDSSVQFSDLSSDIESSHESDDSEETEENEGIASNSTGAGNSYQDENQSQLTDQPMDLIHDNVSNNEASPGQNNDDNDEDYDSEEDTKDIEDDAESLALVNEEEENTYKGFIEWMMSADGRAQKLRSARGHAALLKAIIHRADPFDHDVNLLFNKHFVTKNWLKPFESEALNGQKRQPETIKNYIYALRIF